MRRVVVAREQYEMLSPWRVAAQDPSVLAKDYTDRLFDEFHDWARERGKVPVGFKAGDLGDYSKPMGGPLCYWDNVEGFLKDKYPAAHRDFRFAEEDVATTLDGKPRRDLGGGTRGWGAPYETGPEAVAKHGYDPRQVAAGMMYLHSNSHFSAGRGDRADKLPRDINRLTDIFDKRQQMQDAYKQRQPVTASVVTASRDGWLLREAIRLATPWHSKPGDPTYRVPTEDLLHHRQFNPAITTPEQMQRSLWTQSYDPKKEPYRNFATPWSSGGSSEGSSEDDLVDAFEKGHKLPPVEITTNGVGATLSDGNHRAEVADMLNHPDLESYIHYDPHKYQDDFHAQQVDPNTELGRQIHKLVQNHPYEPVEGGPTTDHVFRRHPETGEWQRGTVDHSSPPHFVDTPEYAKQMQQHVPGFKNQGLGTYFDVDFGNGPEITHERHLHARVAMADTAKWHPHIELFNDYHDPESDSGAGEYWLRLPDESQPSGKRVVGTATYEYNGPEMYVHGVSVNPRLKGRGIGQALIERMHADHPQRKLNPGETTAEGHGLTQRLMQTMPGKVIPDYQPRPLSAPESKQWLDTQQEYWDRRSKDWDSLKVGMADTAPWHPLITRNLEPRERGSHYFRPGTYDVRVPNPAHPKGGDLVGRLEYTKSKYEPEVYVDSISVHPEHQGKGIAQALIERMVSDHPNHKVNPGVTTAEGTGFTQRLMDTHPDAKSKIAPGWKLDPVSYEGDTAYKEEIDNLWRNRSATLKEVADATH